MIVMGSIVFGSSFLGQIKPVQIGRGQEMIEQKSAVLEVQSGMELSIRDQND